MNSCPFHKVRSDLPPLTERIAKLPVDERGYPVPFFVQWLDKWNGPAEPGTGRPEFRMMDGNKWKRCVREKLCWVCGEKMGSFKAFPIGPMCCVNRVSSEPPSHQDCAQWSVRGCPFLSRPNMERRVDELIRENKGNVSGVSIDRNPGVIAIWTTKSYVPFAVPNGVLIKIGEPVSVEWFTQGRSATRAEALQAIDDGLPLLLKMCGSNKELEECNAAAELLRRNHVPLR